MKIFKFPDRDNSVLQIGEPARTVTPEQFGADPSGATSSDTAFDRLAEYANGLAVSDSAGRGLLINATGNYQLNEEHCFSLSNLTFDFQGRGLINTSAASTSDVHAALTFTRSAVSLQGSLPSGVTDDGLSTQTTMTVNASRNATSFTVASASAFSPGDAFAIISTEEYWNGIDGASGYDISFKGELGFVQSKSGNVITPATPLKDSYLAATYNTYVRKLNLLENITIRGLRGLGSGHGTDHTTSNPTGVRCIRHDFTRNFVMENCKFENFPRFATEGYIGFDSKAISCQIIGRKLDDSTNLPNISEWFTGMMFGGIQGVEVTGCTARYARRLADFDQSLVRMIDDDIDQSIPCRDIHMTGGNSYSCVTGPAGHKYQGLNLVGHTTRWCDNGVQHRGKDLTMSGCDIEARVNALILGVGSSSTEDITLYSEDPDCGFVYITGGRLVSGSGGKGIYATQSWTDFNLSDVLIDSDNPMKFYGKRQSNFRMSNVKINGNVSNPAILSTSLTKTAFSNWRITDSQISSATYGIDMTGSSANAATDLMFERIRFLGVATRYLRFGSSGVPLWGARIIVKDCVSDGGAAAGVSDSFGSGVLEVGNDWTPNVRTVLLASGVLTIPDNIPLGYAYLLRVDAETAVSAPTDPDDLVTITGGFPGQVLVLASASSNRDIVVKNGSDNITCGADFTLTNSLDSITLMKTQTNSWVALATANNAA